MKRLLLLVFLSGACLQAQQVKNELESEIERKYNALTEKRNLILKPLPIGAVNEWNNLLTKIDTFVNTASPDLKNYFYIILNESTNAINTLKLIYNTIISPAIKNPADRINGIENLDPSKINLKAFGPDIMDKLEKTKIALERRREGFIKKKNELKKKFLVRSASKNVREVLVYLADTIEALIGKIIQTLQVMPQSIKRWSA